MISKHFTGFEKLQLLLLEKFSNYFLRKNKILNPFIEPILSAFYLLEFRSYRVLINKLYELGNIAIDVIGEYSSHPDQALRYLDTNLKILQYFSSVESGRVQMAIKPSAFCWVYNKQVREKLETLVSLGSTLNIPIIFDAEDYDTNKVFETLFLELVKSGYRVGCAIQGYWKNCFEILEKIDKVKTNFVWIRLVKGAYFEREKERHLEKLILSPKDVESNLINIIQKIFSSKDSPYICSVGTHNLHFIDQLQSFPKLEFQFLYGLGNGLHRYFTNLGRNSRIYIPIDFGICNPTLYLQRRAMENSNPFGFLKEIVERVLK